jgi:hypothetical protein
MAASELKLHTGQSCSLALFLVTAYLPANNFQNQKVPAL